MPAFEIRHYATMVMHGYKVARYIKSQDSASEGCSLSLSESSTEIQRRLSLSLILANRI